MNELEDAFPCVRGHDLKDRYKGYCGTRARGWILHFAATAAMVVAYAADPDEANAIYARLKELLRGG